MKLNNIIFGLFACLSTVLFAQNNPLAKIGDIEINTSEFLERYELSPILGKLNIADDKGSKYSLLYSMIGEKLWSLEAQKNGIDTFQAVKAPMEIIEKLYIRDALYKKLILSQINITNEEIAQGAAKFMRKLKLKYIFSDNEADIKNKYYLLKSGYSFDSLYNVSVALNNEREVTYGELEENVEETVYNLTPKTFSNPLFYNKGWYIFYLTGENVQTFSDFQGKNNLPEKIKKIIHDRKASKLTDSFYKSYFKNIKAESNKALIDITAKEILNIIKDKKASKDSTGYFFNLTFDEGLYLQKLLTQVNLAKPFVKINKQIIPLQKFINDLVFFGFRVGENNLESIQIKINQRAKQFIEYEVLADEGKKQGLNLDAEVIRQVQMWKDNYLFQVYRNKFVYDNYLAIKDSIINNNSDTWNIRNVYKIIEIEFTDLNLAEKIFDDLLYMNYNTFISKYSAKASINIKDVNLSTADANEINFVSILPNMQIGEIYGPNKIGESYTIIKLIETKTDTVNNPSKKVDIINQTAQNKAGQLVSAKTVEFAKNYGFTVNEELLKSLKVTEINSYIIKIFGFGGRTGAVPLLLPFYNWVEIYNNTKKDNL
ncbi:MAG: hypothetical protein V1773_18365 [bacterium]